MQAIKRILFTPIGELGRTQAEPVAAPTRPERRFRRYQVTLPVTVTLGQRELTGTAATLGMGGLFMPCTAPLPVGALVTVALRPFTEPVALDGKVIYQQDGGVGIRFTGLTPGETQSLKTLCASGKAQRHSR